MKVVYVSTLPHGGPVSHLHDLATAVAENGVDVHVVCANASVADGFAREGIASTVVPVVSKFDLIGAAGLWRVTRADIVHTHDRRAGLFGRVTGRAHGARVVHTLHGIPERVALQLGRPAQSVRADLAVRDNVTLVAEAMLARLGTVVVPSEALANFVLQHGFPATRLRVVPNGIALQRSAPPPRRQPATVGTAATLDHHKGIDVLLRAAASSSQPVALQIFGDGPARPELEHLTAQLGVAATFHGFVHDFRQRVGGLDVFVLPTRGDNFPVAILEAMASAVPVVATAVGGIPELVVHEQTGLLVPPDDPAALAAAIDRLLASEELRLELGRGGARRIQRHFESGDVARRMVALYEHLLA